MLGYFSGTAWNYVNEPQHWRVDLKAYDFIAYQSGTTVHFMRTDVPPGMKQPTDIAKAKGLVVGGLSADNPKDLRLRLALDMLGVPFKYVTGYRSSMPARLALPGGRSAAIDYAREVPTLEARAQHLFGLAGLPPLAGGRVPLQVALLSPAGRPIAVTSDLAGFWKGAWAEVRKEMRGRYPRHACPEDPAAASG